MIEPGGLTPHDPTGIRTQLKVHGLPLVSIILLILAANSLALSGLFDDDPAIFLTRLGVHIHPGLPGLPNWTDPNIGYTLQAIGHLAAEDWLHGVVPWWDPYSGIGMPLEAAMSNYALFLPFVLLLHFHAGWLWVRILFQICAAVFTYCLLVQLGVSRLAGTLAAVMYGCMGSFILIGDAPAATFACLPLLLLGLEHARSATIAGKSMGWSLITIAVAWSSYASFPETAFLGDLLGGIWFICRLIKMPSGYTAVQFSCKFFGSAWLGLLLSAPCLVPFVEYVRQGFIGDHAALFATDHLPVVGIAIELLPHIFGPFSYMPSIPRTAKNFTDLETLYHTWGNTGGWIGILPIMFALLSLTTRDQTNPGIRWWLFGWVLVWQARTFGVPGFTFVLNLAPPFHTIYVERYAEPSCDFAIILLAAFAVDDWQRSAISTSKAVIALLLGCGLMFGAVIAVEPTLRVLRTNIPFLGLVALVYVAIISVFLLIAFMLVRRPPNRAATIALAGLLMFDTLVGFGFSQASGRRSGYIDTSGIAYIRAHSGLQRIFTLGPITPSYGAFYDVKQINHDALPVPRLWTDYVVTHLDPFADPIIFDGRSGTRPKGTMDQAAELRARLASYEALGVKFVVATPGQNPFGGGPAGTPPKVFQNDVMDIYQLRNPAPYFSATGNSCQLSASTQSTLMANCPAPAVLTRREMVYPGWRATVNGRPEVITPMQTIFQSIKLPAGNSVVRFSYAPTHLRASCLAAIAALLIWFCCGCAKIMTANKYRPANRRNFPGTSKPIIGSRP